jgi:hypothetical protein
MYVFLDFTVNHTVPTHGLFTSTNPAFTHMVAAMLAVTHFNQRNSTIVPQLAQPFYQECPIKLDWNQSRVFDTGSIGHSASRQFVESLMDPLSFLSSSSFLDTYQEGRDNDFLPSLDSLSSIMNSNTPRLPCAIAGVNSDFPASELSVLAQATQTPLVAYRSFNERVVLDDFSPFSNQVWPDVVDTTRFTVNYLLSLNRTDYVEILYRISDTNIQRREILTWTLEAANITWNSRAMLREGQVAPGDIRNARSPMGTLQALKESGYRTIIVFLEDARLDFPLVAEAADSLGMTKGDYVWFWFGPIDPIFLHTDNPVYNNILYGSGTVMPMDPLLEELKTGIPSPLMQAWHTVTPDFIDLVNQANPIQPGEAGYVYADETFFRQNKADFGAGFIYDAVMSIGIGACAAAAQGNRSSTAHLQGIRQSPFYGATGRVEYLNRDGRSGTRDPYSVPWGVVNVLPGRPGQQPFEFSTLWLSVGNSTQSGWIEQTPFVFADGTTTGPPLRTMPEQNYLSPGLQIMGLSLMSIAILLAILSIVWVFVQRNHRVVLASQPIFLYIISFGCIIQASTIFVLSFDESFGWSEEALSAACMASPWLYTLGHILIYGALACKLYRVNKVLQVTRHRIEVRQVIWPLALFFVAAVAVLTVWTVVDERIWERDEINPETGESIGQCSSSESFFIPLAFLLVIPMIMTGVMAWKTKDVSEDFSEARWIWILIIVQLEVFLVAAPTFVILRDVSTDARYFGSTILLWMYPMSVLALIIFPKYIAYRKQKLGLTTQPRRGELLGVRVTGVHTQSNGNLTACSKESTDSKC